VLSNKEGEKKTSVSWLETIVQGHEVHNNGKQSYGSRRKRNVLMLKVILLRTIIPYALLFFPVELPVPLITSCFCESLV